MVSERCQFLLTRSIVSRGNKVLFTAVTDMTYVILEGDTLAFVTKRCFSNLFMYDTFAAKRAGRTIGNRL